MFMFMFVLVFCFEMMEVTTTLSPFSRVGGIGMEVWVGGFRLTVVLTLGVRISKDEDEDDEEEEEEEEEEENEEACWGLSSSSCWYRNNFVGFKELEAEMSFATLAVGVGCLTLVLGMFRSPDSPLVIAFEITFTQLLFCEFVGQTKSKYICCCGRDSTKVLERAATVPSLKPPFKTGLVDRPSQTLALPRWKTPIGLLSVV